MRLIIDDTKEFAKAITTVGSILSVKDYWWTRAELTESVLVDARPSGTFLATTDGRHAVIREIPVAQVFGDGHHQSLVTYQMLKNLITGITFPKKNEPVPLGAMNILPFTNVTDVVTDVPCDTCDGNGRRVCLRCNSVGQLSIPLSTQKCFRCDGEGSYPCTDCLGVGISHQTTQQWLGETRLTGMKKPRVYQPVKTKKMGLKELADDALSMAFHTDSDVEIASGGFTATLRAKRKAYTFPALPRFDMLVPFRHWEDLPVTDNTMTLARRIFGNPWNAEWLYGEADNSVILRKGTTAIVARRRGDRP